MIEIPVSGRRLLEVAKRVRARVLEETPKDRDGRPKRYPTDAELAVLIQAEIEHGREAHRERMRAYYRRRRAEAKQETGGRRRTRGARRGGTD